MRCRLTILAFAMATAAGCGRVTPASPDGGGDGEDPFGAGQHSGTRIKIEYFEFDSARLVIGVRDSERQEYCAFAPWRDGSFYCTPVGVGQIAFSDDQCTNKVGLASSDPCFPSHYFQESVTECGTRTYSHLYSSGPQTTLTQYYTRSGGNCTAHPAAGTKFHTLGPEVDPTGLVKGAIGAPEGKDRIQSRFVTTADGLRLALTLKFDSQLDADCFLRPNGRCMPQSFAQTTFFQDAGCTSPAATVRNSCPEKLVPVPGVCAYRKLGPKIQSTTRYFDSSGSCLRVDVPADESQFELGTQVSAPTLGRAPVANGRRIQRVQFASGGLGDPINLFDAEKQTECFPGILADGGVYCFPTGAPVLTKYYADKNCTAQVEVIALLPDPTGCDSPTVPTYAVKSTNDSQSCARNAESRPVGSVHTGQLYERISATCTPASPAFTYYDVGAALPLSQLARGALVVDR